MVILEAQFRRANLIFLSLANQLETASQFLQLEAKQEVLVLRTVAVVAVVVLDLGLHSGQDRLDWALVREQSQVIAAFFVCVTRGSTWDEVQFEETSLVWVAMWDRDFCSQLELLDLRTIEIKLKNSWTRLSEASNLNWPSPRHLKLLNLLIQN